MQISPGAKKILSGVAVGLAAAVFAEIAHDLPQLVAFLPVWGRGLAVTSGVGLLTGAAHIVDAWGHTERVAQAVEKAQASVPGAEG